MKVKDFVFRPSLHPPWLPPRRTLTVLVTAHPDDESMFFVPTLQGLVRDQINIVWILWQLRRATTTGNYDGLGAIRITGRSQRLGRGPCHGLG